MIYAWKIDSLSYLHQLAHHKQKRFLVLRRILDSLPLEFREQIFLTWQDYRHQPLVHLQCHHLLHK